MLKFHAVETTVKLVRGWKVAAFGWTLIGNPKNTIMVKDSERLQCETFVHYYESEARRVAAHINECLENGVIEIGCKTRINVTILAETGRRKK